MRKDHGKECFTQGEQSHSCVRDRRDAQVLARPQRTVALHGTGCASTIQYGKEGADGEITVKEEVSGLWQVAIGDRGDVTHRHWHEEDWNSYSGVSRRSLKVASWKLTHAAGWVFKSLPPKASAQGEETRQMADAVMCALQRPFRQGCR